MDNPSRNNLEIESELFSLVNSILKLNSHHEKGTINHNFFRKTIKNAMDNILKINFLLKEKNILLSDILKKMKISDDYHHAIDIINKASKLEFPTDSELPSSILDLPRITSDITSTFITLMDALKLEGFDDIEIIRQLFNDLIEFLKQFPGVEPLISRVKHINYNILNNSYNLIENNKFRGKIVDDLYEVFQEFQAKLDLKT